MVVFWPASLQPHPQASQPELCSYSPSPAPRFDRPTRPPTVIPVRETDLGCAPDVLNPDSAGVPALPFSPATPRCGALRRTLSLVTTETELQLRHEACGEAKVIPASSASCSGIPSVVRKLWGFGQPSGQISWVQVELRSAAATMAASTAAGKQRIPKVAKVGDGEGLCGRRPGRGAPSTSVGPVAGEPWRQERAHPVRAEGKKEGKVSR